MSDIEKENQDIIQELGMIKTGGDFESDIQYINIIGGIEGHSALPAESKSTKYEHLIPQLIAVEENPALKGLFVTLNTMGGDVEAGLALSEMISTLSKPTVSLVLGGGHSIGIPLATATDYSFIAGTATMTLHPIRTTGLVITAEMTFEYMRKTQERVVDFIANHSRAQKEDIVKLMNCSDNMSPIPRPRRPRPRPCRPRTAPTRSSARSTRVSSPSLSATCRAAPSLPTSRATSSRSARSVP